MFTPQKLKVPKKREPQKQLNMMGSKGRSRGFYFYPDSNDPRVSQDLPGFIQPNPFIFGSQEPQRARTWSAHLATKDLHMPSECNHRTLRQIM